MMKKLYITSLILLSVSTVATPAFAACAPEATASSTVRSCEGGVTVYRGQINGPDFRIIKIQQDRDLAKARLRSEEARAQTVSRQRSQAATAPRPSGPISTGRSSFVFTPFAQNNARNFGNRSGLNLGGGLNRTGFARNGFVGSFGRNTSPARIPLALANAQAARGVSTGGRR
ncbi:MAG: hypothetical protein ABJ275_06405 [Maricaulaceae bacterium]